MSTDESKYTRVEYERRFLVPTTADWRATAEPGAKRIEDKYLRDTRLRLRVVTETAPGSPVLKLTKKSDSPSPYYRTLSRILLSSPRSSAL